MLPSLSCLFPLLAFPWLLQELVLSFHHVKPEADSALRLDSNSLCPLKHVASLPFGFPCSYRRPVFKQPQVYPGPHGGVIHMLNNSGCDPGHRPIMVLVYLLGCFSFQTNPSPQAGAGLAPGCSSFESRHPAALLRDSAGTHFWHLPKAACQASYRV